MIIDCHGHFTTAPKDHEEYWRTLLNTGGARTWRAASISESELRECIEPNQLQRANDRGIDLTLLSPKASAMGHDQSDGKVARLWSEASNNLIHEVVGLYPDNFAGVCQLPQTVGAPMGALVHELRRCVEELGFVGCNLNPDPSGGEWSSPPITDSYWFPLYEALCELDVPAMIHVSNSTNRNLHTTGSHYLNADTVVFMQLLEGNLFELFPELRLIIPHGGGAVPYHWGRFRGLAERFGHRPPEELFRGNLYFDTCVYHRPGLELLFEVVGAANIVFASETFGAVRGADPRTGIEFDNTKGYIDEMSLSKGSRDLVFHRNPVAVYPRLERRLVERPRQ